MTLIPNVTLSQIVVPQQVLALVRNQERRPDDAKSVAEMMTEFKDGDYFVSLGGGLTIWGQVSKEAPVRPSNEVLASLSKDQRDELLDDYAAEVEMYESLEEGGYLFGNCYSVMCPEGEMGSTHVTMVTAKVDEATFLRAKINGWRHVDPTN